MDNKGISRQTSANFIYKNASIDGEIGDGSRPVQTGDENINRGFLFSGGSMSEQDIKARCGELILEGQRIKMQAEKQLLRKGLTEKQTLVSIAVWIAILVLLVLSFVLDGKAHAMDCSFYSEAALRRDGQDKITNFQMANGEYFNDNLMCGANGYGKYPLNSVIRITNPANGRHTEIVIKDRINKRFASKRIDLSPRAFAEICDPALGLKQGIVQDVIVEVL